MQSESIINKMREKKEKRLKLKICTANKKFLILQVPLVFIETPSRNQGEFETGRSSHLNRFSRLPFPTRALSIFFNTFVII